MPSETEKQRKFMGADLQRAREGKKTRTGMSEDQLSDFASKPLAKSISERIDKIEKAVSPLHVHNTGTGWDSFEVSHNKKKLDSFDAGDDEDKDWQRIIGHAKKVGATNIIHHHAEGTSKYKVSDFEKALAPDATPKDFDEKKAETSAREQRDRKAANHTEWAKKIDEREGVERPAGYKPKLPVQMRNSPKVEKGEIPTCKCGSKDLRHDAKAGETHCAECGRTFGDSVKKEDWSRVHASYREMVRHLPDAKHNEKVLTQLKGAAKNIDAKQEGSHFKGEDQGHSTPRGYPPVKKEMPEPPVQCGKCKGAGEIQTRSIVEICDACGGKGEIGKGKVKKSGVPDRHWTEGGHTTSAPQGMRNLANKEDREAIDRDIKHEEAYEGKKTQAEKDEVRVKKSISERLANIEKAVDKPDMKVYEESKKKYIDNLVNKPRQGK